MEQEGGSTDSIYHILDQRFDLFSVSPFKYLIPITFCVFLQNFKILRDNPVKLVERGKSIIHKYMIAHFPGMVQAPK